MAEEGPRDAKILIVDDEEANVRLLERVLRQAGYPNLLSTTDSRQVVSLYTEHRPDLILLDLRMPYRNGFEILDDLRTLIPEESYVPVLVLTADATSEALGRAFLAGAKDFLAKPLAVQEVLLRIRNLLHTRFLHLALQQQNQALERRVAELAAVNQELDAFGYSISHDLRAPLRALQGFAGALLADHGDRLDATGRDYAQRIVAASRHMDVLIQDLLAYSHLGRTEMSIQPIGIASVVDEVREQLGVELEERGAEITVERPLPRVMAHRTVLSQIVTNLLTNAVKFVAPDVSPRIRIWSEARGDWVRTWVEDNGIGIAPEHRERIFRPFERLHGVQQYPGTGIGLAIVHKGTARMGGQAGVESAPGGGSRFWIELRGVGGTS